MHVACESDRVFVFGVPQLSESRQLEGNFIPSAQDHNEVWY